MRNSLAVQLFRELVTAYGHDIVEWEGIADEGAGAPLVGGVYYTVVTTSS
jgi:hypothetical protein